jgi:hypothetical protein
MEQIALNWAPEAHYFSVSELTAAMRGLLAEHSPAFGGGEISGAVTSSHYYHLRTRAQIRCVCYKMTARYLEFKPQDGMRCWRRAHRPYDARGEVQLVVEAIEPQGHGALQPLRAVEELETRADRRFAPAASVAGAHQVVAHRRGHPRCCIFWNALRTAHPPLSGRRRARARPNK